MGYLHRFGRATRHRVNPPSKKVAALTAIGLSLLFVAVYGSCNWLATQRAEVGTWYYAWERFIPFVPWMIIPYMSIDLFFVAAPFLCDSRVELKTLSRRIAFGILVAGGFFLLMPLTNAVPRPVPDDWTAPIYRFLHGFDQPHNLFPSLHITLRTILAHHYARHTRGTLRILSGLWFSLIGFSTLLTYQHHVADVVGGFVLAGASFYLIRETDHARSSSTNRRVGLYYAVGAILTGAIAWAGWPWTFLLLWPAAALGLVAAAYFGLGSGIYRKRAGQLALISRVLFAPVLFGQWLSLWHYRRRCPAWNEVTPNVWIGARLNEKEADAARQAGLTAVLDLTAEFSETDRLQRLSYLNIPLLDLTAPNLDQLRQAVEFITQQARTGIVCVHCKIGYSRSAVVAGAFLLSSGSASTVGQAVAHLKIVRPGMVVRPEAIHALQKFHAALNGFNRTGA
jgi:membrane-associated phospholipid phosphatase/predicted protein tyrosine phosphatase